MTTAVTTPVATAPEPGAAADFDAMLATKVDAMKALQAKAQEARNFLVQCEQEGLRLDGQMRLLVDLGAKHPEIIPPPPIGEAAPAAPHEEPNTQPSPTEPPTPAE